MLPQNAATCRKRNAAEIRRDISQYLQITPQKRATMHKQQTACRIAAIIERGFFYFYPYTPIRAREVRQMRQTRQTRRATSGASICATPSPPGREICSAIWKGAGMSEDLESMERTSLVFPRAMMAELRRYATIDDRSLASEVRIAVREYLDRRRKVDNKGGRRGQTQCL